MPCAAGRAAFRGTGGRQLRGGGRGEPREGPRGGCRAGALRSGLPRSASRPAAAPAPRGASSQCETQTEILSDRIPRAVTAGIDVTLYVFQSRAAPALFSYQLTLSDGWEWRGSEEGSDSV